MTDRKKPGSVALNLRVSPDVRARLDALVMEGLPFARHRLAVLALERGLAMIEKDPAVLLKRR